MTINLVHRMGPSRRTSCWSSRSPSTRPTDPSSDWSAVSSAARRCSTRSPPNWAGHDAPILEYARLRAQISEMERAQSRASRLQRRQAASDALAALRRGDIITITHGRRGGLAVVLESARDSSDPRPLVLTEHRWAGRISSADYSGASAPVGSMTLPKRVEHRQPRVRRDLASALRSAAAGLAVPAGRRVRRRPVTRTARFTIRSWRRCGRNCAVTPHTTLPAVEAQIRQAERYLRIERDNAQLEKKVAAATNSLARTFDRIVGLLTEREFIQGPATDPACHRRRPVAGPHLQRERPVGRRMPAHRRVGGSEAGRVGGGGLGGALRDARQRRPQRPVRRRGAHAAIAAGAASDVEAVHPALRADEQTHRIAPSREPDDGFVSVIYRWARTGDLAAALAAADARPAGHRFAVVGGGFRAVVPAGARPAGPGSQRRAGS